MVAGAPLRSELAHLGELWRFGGPALERLPLTAESSLVDVDAKQIAPSGLNMYRRVTVWPCFWIASMVMNTGVA